MYASQAKPNQAKQSKAKQSKALKVRDAIASPEKGSLGRRMETGVIVRVFEHEDYTFLGRGGGGLTKNDPPKKNIHEIGFEMSVRVRKVLWRQTRVRPLGEGSLITGARTQTDGCVRHAPS